MDKHRVILVMDREQLQRLFLGSGDDGRRLYWDCDKVMPADLRILSIWGDPWGRSMSLMCESSEFPLVPDDGRMSVWWVFAHTDDEATFLRRVIVANAQPPAAP